MAAQGQDLTIYAGFGSWMSTLSAQPPQPKDKEDEYHHKTIHELDSHVNDVHEIDSGYSPRPQLNNPNQVHELPANESNKPTLYDPNQYPDTPVYVPDPYPHTPIYVPVPDPDPPRPSPQPYVPYEPVLPYCPKPALDEDWKKKATPPVPIPIQPVFKETPDLQCKIEIQGLQRLRSDQQYCENITISAYSSLADIAAHLQKQNYIRPLAFTSAKSSPVPLQSSTGISEPPWPVLITTGAPCYDPDAGLRMHIDQPFQAFLSRLLINVKCANDIISVNETLEIAFHRTLRVPDDGKTHLLPASFGRFAVRSVGAYAAKLERSGNASLLDMKQKGGVFLPMYQREAMWLEFKMRKDEPREFKIRVFVGGVNVVTGKVWDDPSAAIEGEQDYVLVPAQKHLDGIAVGHGLVRQFVAMPVFSGYSIEKQITGKEVIGGMQIEITPRGEIVEFVHEGREIEWASKKFPHLSTPRSMDLGVGDMIGILRYPKSGYPPVLDGKKRKAQKRWLSELVKPVMLISGQVLQLTALYPVQLQIKMPGKMIRSKITTEYISPLLRLSEILDKAQYKGRNLNEYELWRDNRRVAPWQTIYEAGLTHMAVLEAKPKTNNKMEKEKRHSFNIRPSGRQSAPNAAPSMVEHARPMDSPYSPPTAIPTIASQHHYTPASASPTSPAPVAPMAYQPQHVYGGSPVQGSPGATVSPVSSVASMTPLSYSAPGPILQSYGSVPAAQTAYSQNAMAPLSFGSPPPTQISYDPTVPVPQSFGSSALASMQPYNSPAPSQAPRSSAPPSQPFTSQPVLSYPAPTPASPPPAPKLIKPLPHSPSRSEKEEQKSPPSSWAMSLAPGGLLSQQIHADPSPFPSSSRNPPAAAAAAALVSVQLLNSVLWESITGHPTPATPISAAAYVKAGIPWFDTYSPASEILTPSTSSAARGLKSVSALDAESAIEVGVSVGADVKTACAVCEKRLCDIMVRPCGHVFCRECVEERMRMERNVVCRFCGVVGEVVGFAAPMGMPGEEGLGGVCGDVGVEGKVVVRLGGGLDRGVGVGIWELE